MEFTPEQIISFLKSKSLVFSEETVFDQIKRRLHRLVLPIKNANQNNILKLLLDDEPDAVRRFKTEKEILKSFQDFKFSKILTNKLIESGDELLPWFLVEAVNGDIGGNIFEFDKQFAGDCLVDAVLELFGELQVLGRKVNQSIDYIVDNRFVIEGLKRFDNPELIKYRSVITSYHQKIANRPLSTLSHSDLTPLNFLFSENGVGVIDWETVCLQDKVFDPAYVYQRLWRYPDCQGKLKNRLFKDYLSESDSRAFDFYIVLLLSIDIQTISTMIDRGENRLYQDKKIYRKDYLQDLFELYIEKLDELVKSF
ncbi:MAG: phosphotransferase [Patescibacteria group bacterium]